MENKKFIRYQLKCWIPVFVVSIIFMAIVYWIEVASMNILYIPSDYAAYLNRFGASAILSVLIPAMILTFVYPFSVFDYRFFKTGADTFLQLPLKERQLKRTRLNLSLGMLLIGFTFTFWIGVLFLVIRVNTTVLDAEQIAEGIHISNYNFLGYFLVYLFSLIFLAVEFYTNAFLVQLGNTVNEGMVYMMMGQVILFLIEYSFHLYILYGFLGTSPYYSANPQVCTFSIGTPIYLIYYLFNDFTVGASNVTRFASLAVNEWINLIVPLLVGIGSAIALYLLPDPSGEHYGKQGPRNTAISIIPHVFAFLVGLTIFRIGSLPVVFMLYLLYVLGYYITLVSLYKTFRIPKRQIIILASVSGAILVLSIIPYTTNTMFYY